MLSIPLAPSDNSRCMDATPLSLPTLDKLREHVLHVLCAHDRLDPQQTPLHEAVITRSGKPCGLFFKVEGPRQLKIHAVWTSAERRILFYDAGGVRFKESCLRRSPSLVRSVA